MSTLDELERELGSALRATLDEMITGPDDDLDTTEATPEPRQAPVTPGTKQAAHRQLRRTWVAAAAALIAVATIGAMAWTQRPHSSVQTNTPGRTVSATTSPVTTGDPAEDSDPDPIDAADIDASARPTSFPIWPDDPAVDITTEILMVGWGGAPITVAVVERSGDRADPIVVGASTAKFETIIAETGGEAVGAETLGDGTPATEYALPGGASALTWETPAGTTVFVAGADPAGFVGQLGDGALVDEDQTTGAGDPSFRLGVLPDDYQVTVPPTYSPKTKVAAITHVRDPFDRMAGVASIEASPHPGVLSVLFFTRLEPVELTAGTPAWWTHLPDRGLEMLIWQQDNNTWVRTLGTDRSTILDEVDGLSWVDEDTWTRRYGTEDNESAPSSDVALSWTPSHDTGSLARSTVTGIVAGPTGFVATGMGYDDQRNQGRVWFSADGLTWQEPALDVFDTLVVSTPVATSTAFYVAAATNTDRTSDDEGEAQLTLPDAYLYRSVDGIVWERWGESLGELPLIAAAGDGVLRYARPNSVEDARDPVERPKWWSADGSSWSHAEFEGDDVGSVGLLIDEFDAIAVAGTTYVAGYLHTDQGGEFGLWSSADGLAWEHLPEPPGPGQFVSAAGDPLLVDRAGSGTYRYDPDLRTWETVVSDGSTAPPPAAEVVEVGDLLVATTAADSGSLTAWTSPNRNLDWQPDPNSTVQPDLDRAIVDAPLVAASGDRVVVAANLSSRPEVIAPTPNPNSAIIQVGVLDESPS